MSRMPHVKVSTKFLHGEVEGVITVLKRLGTSHIDNIWKLFGDLLL
jgi:hypothetical protein